MEEEYKKGSGLQVYKKEDWLFELRFYKKKIYEYNFSIQNI